MRMKKHIGYFFKEKQKRKKTDKNVQKTDTV